INLVTDVVDNAVIKRPKSKSVSSSYKSRSGRRRKRQHLCLDKGYKSTEEEQELIKRGFVLHIPIKKKRKGKVEGEEEVKVIPFCKKYSPKRWVVERTNSWHNRFRKLFTRYEKRSEYYLGLVQLSCCISIYRKIILGWALNCFKCYRARSPHFVIILYYYMELIKFEFGSEIRFLKYKNRLYFRSPA
ncbi:MAG: transposase, partial [Candidatus Nitrosocosmicus sp.]|nr:transposase [Candidatus Nitrosocosmicus sp.]MDN5867301.1 transposase [Candidatus Nitrosocosmicus sp.]